MQAVPKTNSLILFALLALCGCEREAWTAFYHVEVSSDYPLTAEEWVFATDVAGNILDVKQISGRNLRIELHTPIASLETFTLHHVTFSFSDASWITVYANSYTDVPVGGTWHLQAIDYFPKYLPAWVQTTGIDGHAEDASVSSVRGNQTLTRTATGTFPTEVEFKVSTAGDFLVSRFYNNKFLYGFLHNIEPSTHSILTLKEIDQPLIIDLPVDGYAHLELAGYHNGDDLSLKGYINSVIDEPQASGPVTMGYVDGFDKYRTLISYGGSGSSVKTYEKRGDRLAQQPEFEEPTLTIVSDKMTDLSGSISIPYQYAVFNFNGSSQHHQMSWAIWLNSEGGTSFNYKLPSLPKIISSRFPFLVSKSAKFTGGSFYQFKDDYRYADKLNELSDLLLTPRVSSEYFSYRFEYY